MFFARFVYFVAVAAGLTSAQQTSAVPENNGRRPWYFNELSNAVVEGALELRKSGVSEAEASSVAKHIVDDGLKPSQYTEMASMALHWAERMKVPVTSLSEVASIFASAYTSLHTQQSYSSLIQYVKQHTSIYDMSRLFPSPNAQNVPQHTDNVSDPGERVQRMLESIYMSINADPTGREALETFSKIVDRYEQDFGFPVPQRQTNGIPYVGFIYNYII